MSSCSEIAMREALFVAQNDLVEDVKVTLTADKVTAAAQIRSIDAGYEAAHYERMRLSEMFAAVEAA